MFIFNTIRGRKEKASYMRLIIRGNQKVRLRYEKEKGSETRKNETWMAGVF